MSGFDIDFDEVFTNDLPFNQALEESIDNTELEKGYKVEFAKEASKELLNTKVKFDELIVQKWVKLFKFIEGNENGI